MWRAGLLSLGLHALAIAGWWCGGTHHSLPVVAETPVTVTLSDAAERSAHMGGAAAAGGGVERRADARAPARRRSLKAAAPVATAPRQAAMATAPATGLTGGAEASTHAGAAQKEEGRSDGDHEALYGPAYLENPQPSYPERSRQLGEEGEVLLRVRVGANGQALMVTLARSSGFHRLDQTAMDAVARWRFVPARRGGTVVESELTVPVRFQP
ncbi:hypothetical protein BI344_13690 [Chromobacterium sphagni]|uniref:TonB C-terminal domain-containing protein n=1 Tax=Chromobacterium sphagni TaxID=1903179 RepID=A0ABX3CFP1_9NEIS|nr:hypothetical protein BI344_13690 [Chromobacterium sphagni]